MIFLLDTNAVSDLMRKDTKFRERVDALPAGDDVVTSVIVRGELLYGLERMPSGKRRSQLTEQATELFRQIDCEPLPVVAADHYFAIRLARSRAGLSLDANDTWIAAAALSLGATLVSRDFDFRQITGLRVEDWTK